MRPTHSIALLICCCVGGNGAFLARSADQPGAPAAITNAAARVPLPPLPKPQVTYFRELLALSPGELDRALANIAEPGRRRLQAKLQEYAALAPDEREARLRATELRWYFAPLMRTPPTNRVAQLALVPDEYRTMVEARLKLWDALTPETQRQVQESEWTIRYILQNQAAAAAQRAGMTNDLPLPQREKLEQQLVSWLALPDSQRQRLCERFQQFFELSAKEKEKILSAFPDAERSEMNKTLHAFADLPSAQRGLCVNSFRIFSNMTQEERSQFLRNAERWKAMPRGDRQTWRTIVTKLPPLPPGFGEPPLPPGIQKKQSGPTPSPVPAPVNLTNAVP
jgi:hypothetical protein